MAQRPQPTAFVDPEGMKEALDGYSRCLYHYERNEKITAVSGKHPSWRRFQKDLHGPTVNIQGHGYAMTHVHKRTMSRREMQLDDDIENSMPECNPYSERADVCMVTLTPIVNLMNEGVEGPRTRP